MDLWFLPVETAKPIAQFFDSTICLEDIETNASELENALEIVRNKPELKPVWSALESLVYGIQNAERYTEDSMTTISNETTETCSNSDFSDTDLIEEEEEEEESGLSDDSSWSFVNITSADKILNMSGSEIGEMKYTKPNTMMNKTNRYDQKDLSLSNPLNIGFNTQKSETKSQLNYSKPYMNKRKEPSKEKEEEETKQKRKENRESNHNLWSLSSSIVDNSSQQPSSSPSSPLVGSDHSSNFLNTTFCETENYQSNFNGNDFSNTLNYMNTEDDTSKLKYNQINNQKSSKNINVQSQHFDAEELQKQNHHDSSSASTSRSYTSTSSAQLIPHNNEDDDYMSRDLNLEGSPMESNTQLMDPQNKPHPKKLLKVKFKRIPSSMQYKQNTAQNKNNPLSDNNKPKKKRKKPSRSPTARRTSSRSFRAVKHKVTSDRLLADELDVCGNEVYSTNDIDIDGDDNYHNNEDADCSSLGPFYVG